MFQMGVSILLMGLWLPYIFFFFFGNSFLGKSQGRTLFKTKTEPVRIKLDLVGKKIENLTGKDL